MNKKALQKISSGLYIISSTKDGKPNAQIANTVMQVAAEPVILTVSINKQNLTHDFIKSSRKFSVSILAEETPLEFIANFGFKSGRDIDKFEKIQYKMTADNLPVILENTVGFLTVDVEDFFDAYTHTIFKGRLVNAEIFNDNIPLTYKFYHEIKKGKSPKTAPVYFKEDEFENNEFTGKYKCGVCGYVYDPEKGDGTNPPMNFENLPEDWICPVCGAAKSKFRKME